MAVLSTIPFNRAVNLKPLGKAVFALVLGVVSPHIGPSETTTTRFNIDG
jgi:hypothetical protein